MSPEVKAFVEGYARPFYEAPGRHYHNWQHVLTMLAKLEGCPDEVYLATVFHDLIYVPGSATNEADSAEAFHDFWEDYESNILFRIRRQLSVNRVKELILATRTHEFKVEETRWDTWTNNLLRADLAVLHAPARVYKRYREGIYREYAHVPAQEFALGRYQVLGKLLDYLVQQTQFYGRADVINLHLNLDGERELLKRQYPFLDFTP